MRGPAGPVRPANQLRAPPPRVKFWCCGDGVGCAPILLGSCWGAAPASAPDPRHRHRRPEGSPNPSPPSRTVPLLIPLESPRLGQSIGRHGNPPANQRPALPAAGPPTTHSGRLRPSLTCGFWQDLGAPVSRPPQSPRNVFLGQSPRGWGMEGMVTSPATF